jgi:hypothetical protein
MPTTSVQGKKLSTVELNWKEVFYTNCDMVPSLSPRNMAQIEIGKDFMLKHGYIKNDFDVYKWARPEFLEQAAKELLEERWRKETSAKLPETTKLLEETKRIG